VPWTRYTNPQPPAGDRVVLVILFYFMAPSFPGWATKNWLPTLFSQSLHLDMTQPGRLPRSRIAVSSFAACLPAACWRTAGFSEACAGGSYTSAIGLGLTVPALVAMGLGEGLAAAIGGALLFGMASGCSTPTHADPLPVRLATPSRRGVRVDEHGRRVRRAQVTRLLGQSTDAGRLGRDLAFLAVRSRPRWLSSLRSFVRATANKTRRLIRRPGSGGLPPSGAARARLAPEAPAAPTRAAAPDPPGTASGAFAMMRRHGGPDAQTADVAVLLRVIVAGLAPPAGAGPAAR